MSELITTYLNQSGKKSFYYFLRHYRDEIIVMIPVTSRWKDLDNAWSNKFIITGAGKLGEDLKRVRYAKNFEEYWTDAINECKIKEDILVYEAEEARIQDELSRLRHKLSEIQEKVKMQNSSNREMDEDSALERKNKMDTANLTVENIKLKPGL
ncbi:9497_t:CDS:2 [Entrophospora sp. SA101]|nr:9497_t:CDS:2 [Entrophospora sp. SA101]